MGTATLGQNTEEEEDRFAVRAGRFLYGCGAFFALKIQKAKSVKELEEFAKEAENLEKLRGHSNIVQIRDHTIMRNTRHVVILMELAACDLHSFFGRSDYSFDVSGIFSLWHSLVRAVDAAHGEEIIHRDLKPQNFLLVPIAPPFADRILATTTIPPEKFEFRIMKKHFPSSIPDEDEDRPNRVEDDLPDVELVLRDQQTGIAQEVVQLTIKLSDFGLARPLEIDASHLSIRGHAGTLKYMAPETFRPSTDGLQRLSKRVDVWALGVMLFQMLHSGKTPFDRYCTKDNNIGAAVAIASEFIHKEVMKFERQRVWDAERKTLQLHDLEKNTDGDAPVTTTDILCQRPVETALSLLSTEFLFRMCEKCLTFEAADRAEAGDLKRWVEHVLDRQWWRETMESLSQDSMAPLEALLSGVSMEEGGAALGLESQLDEKNLVRQGGERIEQVFFPELRRASLLAVALPPRGKSLEALPGSSEEGHQVRVVGLPARGEAQALEEREREHEESDDGAQLQATLLPARGETFQERERDEYESDDGARLQAAILPARAVDECEQSDAGAQLHVVAHQELLPRCCMKDEDCRREGAVSAELHASQRPKSRRFAPPGSGGSSCNWANWRVWGIIIGITSISIVLAVGFFLFVVQLNKSASASSPPIIPTSEGPPSPAPVSGPPSPSSHVHAVSTVSSQPSFPSSEGTPTPSSTTAPPAPRSSPVSPARPVSNAASWSSPTATVVEQTSSPAVPPPASPTPPSGSLTEVTGSPDVGGGGPADVSSPRPFLNSGWTNCYGRGSSYFRDPAGVASPASARGPSECRILQFLEDHEDGDNTAPPHATVTTPHRRDGDDVRHPSSSPATGVIPTSVHDHVVAITTYCDNINASRHQWIQHETHVIDKTQQELLHEWRRRDLFVHKNGRPSPSDHPRNGRSSPPERPTHPQTKSHAGVGSPASATRAPPSSFPKEEPSSHVVEGGALPVAWSEGTTWSEGVWSEESIDPSTEHGRTSSEECPKAQLCPKGSFGRTTLKGRRRPLSHGVETDLHRNVSSQVRGGRVPAIVSPDAPTAPVHTHRWYHV